MRYRPIMILAALAKASYVGTLVVYLQDRVSPVQAATGIPDAILTVLFVAAFLKTQKTEVRR